LYTLVSRHISDPKLRIVFSFHPLLIGGNPFAVTRVYSLINTLERRWGVHWAMGGTGALVMGLVNLLSERGVTVRCNAPVTRINVEQGRARSVTLENGEQLDADIVVSNGDPAWTYRYLIDAKHRRHWTDRKVARGKYSMSLFVWYFGTNRRYHDVPHHMIMLGPRYRELLDDIFKHHHLSDDYSLYLHRPSASDPSLAPDGCDAFYVLAPVPHLGSGTDWSHDAERFRQSIQRHLENTVMPDLGQHVVTSKLMTPQDFQDRLWSYQGAAFGLEPILLQSAWFRPHNRSEDVEGLYMVGAGTHPGAGVPGVLMSAKAMSTVVPDV
jgi:phytoene desaturase